MSDGGKRKIRPVERLAALVALLSLAGALALAVIGAVASWDGVLLTVAGILVIVLGVWYAVSRSGFVRAAAVVAALIGIAVLVLGFVISDFSAPRIGGIVVLTAISTATSRFALGKDVRALRVSAAAEAAAPPARRPVLLMNPKSGGGKAEKFHLVDECRKRGIEPIVMHPGDDLLQLAEDAVTRGADVIGMAGGDGSQALVATVAIKHDLPHVVVPAGTRNHFALDLGLDRNDVVGALDAYADGVERRIDLARVNGRVFVNNASLGLYAKIVQSPEYRDAKGKTAAAMLPELLGPRAEPLDLRFTGPDGADHPTAHMILVSNDPYELDRAEGRGTRERLDLGMLGIVAATITDASEVSRLVAFEATGMIRRFPGWLEWEAPHFRVDSLAPVEIGVDGEALTMEPPLVFESEPGALRVRLPRKALRQSPAARAVHMLSRTTLGELVSIARGRP
jgi:diacylglycerol kinase family enzyme